MIEYIKQILGSNPLAQGGLLVLFGGSLMGIFYKGYYLLIRAINYFCFVKISFESVDTENFRKIQYWLCSLSYTKKRCTNFNIRELTLNNKYQAEYADSSNVDNRQVFYPGYGIHYLFLNKRPSTINYYKSDSKDLNFRETIDLSIFSLFNKSGVVAKIIEEINALYNTIEYTDTLIYTCVNNYACWTKLLAKKIKQHPILATEAEYKDLIEDVEHFISNEEWYDKRGIGYKRGYLLSGIPGSGKTSCILSIAQHFKKHIYILNLTSAEIDDNKFIELVSLLPKDAILALEDIDAIYLDRENSGKKEQNTITLSTILNVLDGFYTPNGLIFFITTNYPDKLDKALTRPGRISVFKDFKEANSFQSMEIFKRFFPEATEEHLSKFEKQAVNRPMSLLETHLIKHCNDLERAVTLD